MSAELTVHVQLVELFSFSKAKRQLKNDVFKRRCTVAVSAILFLHSPVVKIGIPEPPKLL